MTLTAQDIYRLRSQISVAKLLECGDVSHWWCTHISQTMPTAFIPSPFAAAELPAAPNPAIWDIQADTDFGRLSLRDFTTHPESGLRGMIVIKHGQIVAETYRDLRPDQAHLWASCAKVAAGLVIELLIEDGLIDDTRPIGTYIPALRDTDWHTVSVRDAMDMTPGMDCEENEATRADPSSTAIRAFLAEFNTPFNGRHETLLEVLQSSKRVRPAGQKFEYGSPCTQVLVLLAEAVSGQVWSELFRQRVWSHMRVDAPLQMHLSPDGIALAHGVASSPLRDMARFGMLFTPSWSRVADHQIVSDTTLARIQTGTREKSFFMDGYDGPVFADRLGDTTMMGNARQWDCVWPDGDMFKSGFMDQGLYVSPARDLVIAYFSTTPNMQAARFLRPVATSELLG